MTIARWLCTRWLLVVLVLLTGGRAAWAVPPWLGLVVAKVAGGGARVTEVLPESPCASPQVAVHPGDVVLALDGQAIAGPAELIGAVQRLRIGQRVRLSLRTPQGEVRQAEVVLGPRQEPDELQRRALINQPAPDFAPRVLAGPGLVAGGALRGLRGSVVLLDFFASWCAPCLEAMPRLSALVRRFPQLRVISLSDEPAALIQPIIAHVQPPYTVAMDVERQAHSAYRVFAFPTLVLIDRGGAVRTVVHGDLLGMERAVEQELLRAPAASGTRAGPRSPVPPRAPTGAVPAAGMPIRPDHPPGDELPPPPPRHGGIGPVPPEVRGPGGKVPQSHSNTDTPPPGEGNAPPPTPAPPTRRGGIPPVPDEVK